MSTKHTPGPWMIAGKTVYALNEDGYNRFSALVQDAHTKESELVANARLIAAAPELLEALQMLTDHVNRYIYGDDDVLVSNARYAIRKALGEEK